MKRWQKIAVAGSLAGVVGILLPLQTYLGNSSIFPFSFWRLLPELLGLFAIFTAGLLLIDFLIRKLSSAVHLFSPPVFFFSLLTAALVCVYLESGILSAGLPELNGGPVAELGNTMRAVVDSGIWVVLILSFLAFARKIASYLHWISLAVVILSLAGLIDVMARVPVDAKSVRVSVDAVSSPRQKEDRSVPIGRGRDSASTGGRGRDSASTGGRGRDSASTGGRGRDSASTGGALSFQPQPTVVANVKYSPTRNILVFVLDSMPGRATVDILRTNATLSAKFPGFTAYPNNIGMHECTKRGVPGIVTGRHYDPAEMSEADYPMTMYGTNSFVMVAAQAGWNVAFSPDLLPYGAINLPIEKRVSRVEKKRSRDMFAFLRQTTEVPFLSLFDTVAFRLSPFFFKGPILYSRIRHAVKGRHSAEGFWGERSMYPQLAARQVNTEARPFLGFFHSWGVHPPWSADFATTVTEKFQSLGKLLDAYRVMGIYEKSLIVVTSDHGLDGVPPLKGYPPSSSALLLVKPEGAAAPFAVSQRQTSHARIASLVKASLAAPQNPAACEATLRADHPLYRAAIREGTSESFKDWMQ